MTSGWSRMVSRPIWPLPDIHMVTLPVLCPLFV